MIQSDQIERELLYDARTYFKDPRIILKAKLSYGEQNRMLVSKYDQDGQYIILGGEDGIVRILSSANKNNLLFTLIPDFTSPVTCLALNQNNNNLKHTMLVSYADGNLLYWHNTSKQILATRKYQKMINCCGFSKNGNTYSFAGQDFKIHIGNIGKNNIFDLKQGKLGEHSNRVYCTKWHPEDPNLLYTGGWDETIFFWDLRQKEAYNKIYGVTAGGESLDIKNDLMLIGNQEFYNQILIYDLKLNKNHLVQWKDYSKQKSKVASCAFTHQLNFVAGTIKTNEVRLFENNKCVDVYNQIPNHLYSVSTSPITNDFVATYDEGLVAIFNYS